MTCREAAQRLNLFLDRELTAEEAAEVQHHLAACGGCTDHFVFVESLQRLVHRCVCRESAPDTLRRRIRARLTEGEG